MDQSLLEQQICEGMLITFILRKNWPCPIGLTAGWLVGSPNTGKFWLYKTYFRLKYLKGAALLQYSKNALAIRLVFQLNYFPSWFLEKQTVECFGAQRRRVDHMHAYPTNPIPLYHLLEPTNINMSSVSKQHINKLIF